MGAMLVMMLAANPSLTIELGGLRNEHGEVRIAVFDSEAGWPEDANKAVRKAVAKIAKGHATVSFEELPPGRYAVVAFHDEDGDGQLTRGMFGLPKEGWAASNGARGVTGPSFRAASFELSASRNVTLQVEY